MLLSIIGSVVIVSVVIGSEVIGSDVIESLGEIFENDIV